MPVDKQVASQNAARAFIGGRFPSVAAALSSGLFVGATRHLAYDAARSIGADPATVSACQVAEHIRQQTLEQCESEARRCELFRLLEQKKDDRDEDEVGILIDGELMPLSDSASSSTVLTDEEAELWYELCSDHLSVDELRTYAYRWQYARRAAQLAQLAGPEPATPTNGNADDDGTPAQPVAKIARGAGTARIEASALFGEGASYSERSINNAVKKGRDAKMPAAMGRPPSMPREIQRELTHFSRVLRKLKCPVFKTVAIDYAIRLLSTHEARLNFMRVDADTGEFIRDVETGRRIYDMRKWDNWYYKRFLADAASDGSGTGNQRVLDAVRAKWGTFDSMKPHYDTLCATLVDEGIAEWNDAYDERDKDETGMPRQPRVLLIKGQEWRLVSMDEVRLEDTTHGQGGGRHARGERIFLADDDDDGEVVGTTHASHTASAVGGSNALGEGLPPFFSFACETFVLEWLRAGPTTVVNGVTLGSQGTCNTKGSVDGKAAITWSNDSLKAAYDAHGGVNATRRGVLVCDGVGTHMTLAFLQHLLKLHVVLVLRTPNCSHLQQVEDLYNFWVLKNGASDQSVLLEGETLRTDDAGWYKVKQAAAQKRLHETGRGDLPFDVLMPLLKPVWERAFKQEGNRIGWRVAGLNENGGVTARPLWRVHAEEQSATPAPKKTAQQRRAEALTEEEATRRANWDALVPAHMAGGSGEKGKKRGTRVSPGDFSKLGFPANSDPCLKWARFLKSLSEIKGWKKPKLEAELTKRLPGTKWKSVDVAIALLVDCISKTYANKPTMHNGECVDQQLPDNLWTILPSHLNDKQRKAYRETFPGRWADEATAEREAGEEEEEEEEEFDPFALA